jgi:predicted S18 family serine protease
VCILLTKQYYLSQERVDLYNQKETKKFITGGDMGGGSSSYKVAKTVAQRSIEDDSVKTASDDTRRRIAAANSRQSANKFWTAMSSGASNNTGATKTTLG